MSYKILIIILIIMQTGFLKAQSDSITTYLSKSDSLKLQELENKIKELEDSIKQRKEKEELLKLMEDASKLSLQEKEEKVNISKKFQSGLRQQQGLNPNISVGGDFFGAISTSKNDLITEQSEFSYGNNNMYMRGLEMSFIAALDPFARGKVFMHIHRHELEVEEAYMELLNLPLNLNLKAGIFYIEYGLLNRYHTHALPQFDRPRVATYYLGLEGMGGTGIAGNILLPKLLFANASSIDISVIDGGNDFCFTTQRKINLLYSGHFKNYYDLSESSYFEYTLSEVTGKNDTAGNYSSYVTSLGIHYRWIPPSRAKYRDFDWKTEFYFSIMEKPGKNTYSKGFYTSIQNRLNARFLVGGRIGYSELPYDRKQSEWDYTICLDYWQSEFVFYRVQYQYNSRNINSIMGISEDYPSEHSFIIQISWAMGPHKHEAY
jgi:hypothetical protein